MLWKQKNSILKTKEPTVQQHEAHLSLMVGSHEPLRKSVVTEFTTKTRDGQTAEEDRFFLRWLLWQ